MYRMLRNLTSHGEVNVTMYLNDAVDMMTVKKIKYKYSTVLRRRLRGLLCGIGLKHTVRRPFDWYGTILLERCYKLFLATIRRERIKVL